MRFSMSKAGAARPGVTRRASGQAKQMPQPDFSAFVLARGAQTANIGAIRHPQRVAHKIIIGRYHYRDCEV
jgi:hypothetical protein